MDAHLLTKIIHMTAVAAALMIFLLRASTLFVGVQGEQPNPAGRKILVAHGVGRIVAFATVNFAGPFPP